MIRSLEIRGFQSHVTTKLEFEPGVNTIIGSTDSGKSAIFRALTWLVNNRPLGTEFIHRGGKECSVTVVTNRGTATRQRRPFNGYVIGSQAYKDIGSNVPPDLVSVLDLQDINIQPQYLPHFLITSPPGQISKYISELLELNTVDVAITELRSEQIRMNRDRASAEESLGQATQLLESLAFLDVVPDYLEDGESVLKGVEGLSAALADLTQLREALCRASQGLEASRTLLDSVSLDGFNEHLQDAAHLEGLLRELRQLRNHVLASEGEVERITGEVHAARLEVDGYKRQYVEEFRRLSVCPFCFTSLTEEHLSEILEKL